MKTQDELGDLVKALEAVEAQRAFPADLPVVIRIDGRRFSKFTKGFRKPFDPDLSSAMRETCRGLVEHTQAHVGYVQSDEITLILQRRHEIDALPFSGRPQKLTSTCASLATALFMRALLATHRDRVLEGLPTFDARAWSVPNRKSAVDALLWRILDARKNGISAACRTVARPREMHGLGSARMIALMAERGVDYLRDFNQEDRLGVLFCRTTRIERIDDETWARIPKRARPASRIVRRRGVIQLQALELMESEDPVAWVFPEEALEASERREILPA